MNSVSVTESHLQLVKRVARSVARTLPRHIPMEDLVGAGSLGLVDAARKFEPSRGVAFDAYAAVRIRGAILDELRRGAAVPRRVRNRRYEVRPSRLATGHLGRAPTGHEGWRGTGPVALQDWVAEANPVLVPYDTTMEDEDGARLAPDGAEGTDHHALFEIRTALARLPLRLQTVLSLYYVDGLTLREIGEVLRVTESRACQLHTRAIAELRERLCPREGGEDPRAIPRA